MICNGCKNAKWDCEEYCSAKESGLSGKSKNWFISDCRYSHKLTDSEFSLFMDGKINAYHLYSEVVYE